jgi:hypothetical protein
MMSQILRRYLAPIIAAFCLGSGAADGALIVQDWQTAADGALTYDTETGLQWLDVDASFHRSFDDVSTQFGMGGNFEGFRYASEAETRLLFTHAGIPDLSGEWNALNYLPIVELQELIGITWGSFGTTWGFTGDSGCCGLTIRVIGIRQQSNPLSSIFMQGIVVSSDHRPDEYVGFGGNWLVRSIPEPTTLVLLGVALAALAYFKLARGKHRLLSRHFAESA